MGLEDGVTDNGGRVRPGKASGYNTSVPLEMRRDSMRLALNQSYRMVLQSDRYFATLYNIFYVIDQTEFVDIT